MRSVLRYALLADGSSDKTLLRIIDWLLDQEKDIAYKGEFVTTCLSAKAGLEARAERAVKDYACDLLFVHRDSEAMSLSERQNEIRTDLARFKHPYVIIVPVRMSEAWLLIDQQAIKSAAGNKNNKTQLQLPSIEKLESLSDPKETLFALLKESTGLSGRRLQNFNPDKARHLVPERIDDFSPLRKLTAFRALEADLIEFIKKFRQQ